MAKVSVEIEIPDGHEIDAGPNVEWVKSYELGTSGIGFCVRTRPAKPLIVCGQPADWPEILNCDWIAKDANGLIFGYLAEPLKGMSSWIRGADGWILSRCLDIDIPGPWDQSKRENPRRKK